MFTHAINYSLIQKKEWVVGMKQEVKCTSEKWSRLKWSEVKWSDRCFYSEKGNSKLI
jgi:hypothetical protein